ncbi:MAG: AAA family ATPase [Burkholderiales bacterium]
MAAQTLKIALLGAESTGKTRLAQDLAAHFLQQGKRVQLVAEYLREWCAREGRTPRQDEQFSIAREQARRVQDAAPCDVLIADTTALMVAVYSDYVFADTTLYPFALGHQRSFNLTLLTGLDLLWVFDGLQREGPQVQAPVDALLRQALVGAQLPFQVVYGQGHQRLENAFNAINAIKSIAFKSYSALATDQSESKFNPDGLVQWHCERCSQPDCEHRLFTALVGKK